MADELQEIELQALRAVISDERLGTYLAAAGFDQSRALSLYLWNVQIGEAFHLPIQAVEVALRNRVGTRLQSTYGSQWWREPTLITQMDNERIADLDLVQRRIRNRRLPLSHGQIVAGLSFGFWVGMLHKRYNPGIWSSSLRATFPDLPIDRNRASLAEAAGRAVWLRNRIWHHEPVFRLDLSVEHAEIMRLLKWLSAAKADWIRSHSRVPDLLRHKP